MNRILYLFLPSIMMCSLFISCSNISRPIPDKFINHYQISNVNVIDVVNKTIKYGHDVEVKNGIIESIKLHVNSINYKNKIPISIDGSEKFLIPGLWDNHSTILKISPEIDFPLYIANGVTSIRSNLSCPNEGEMSIYACMKEKAHWKKSISEGVMLGPNIEGWGTFPITGKLKNHPDLPIFHGATTVEDAKLVVEYYANYPEEHKPFFLKTYNWINPESFASMSRSAKQHGFVLSGHMQRSLKLEDVVDAGQRSIAHARLFMFDCATLPTTFSDNLSIELREGKHTKRPLPELYPLLLASFDEDKCQKKYEYLAQHNVFLNPTLLTRRNDYYVVADKLADIQGLDYVPYLMMMEFEEDSAKLIKSSSGKSLSQDDIGSFKAFYEKSAHSVAQAQKFQVKILAGTDSWSEYNVPGFSLHEELQALSAAGIDNFSVLQAATINGAEYFSISGKLGSIDIGKQSNMVLLDANPIENIKNTQSINSVFKGNQIYTSAQLEVYKNEVKALSNSHMLTVKVLMMFLQNLFGF